jgi:hypothetical protein
MDFEQKNVLELKANQILQLEGIPHLHFMFGSSSWIKYKVVKMLMLQME